MEAILVQPRGFCAGVTRAIDIVERALELHGPPVYVLHEIVHNRHVVDQLRERGAVFVEELEAIPPGSVTVFSAHGVARQVEEYAAARGLRVIDATCPLVAKVHQEAQRYHREGHDLIIIGHRGHPEVEGTRGQIRGRVHVVSSPAEVEQLDLAGAEQVAYVTQTTLSLDDTRDVIRTLQLRFPGIRGPSLDDICYATQNRQNAVKDLGGKVDVLLVVGAENSSNSNRLREVGERSGIVSYRIADVRELDPAWISGARSVGITAGASAPEFLVREVVERLLELGAHVLETEGEPEHVFFALPPAVRATQTDSLETVNASARA